MGYCLAGHAGLAFPVPGSSLDWYILGENEIILLSYVLCHQLSLLEFFLGESFSVEELL